MVNQVIVSNLGLCLVALATITLGIFRMHFGGQWLNRRAKQIRRKVQNPEMDQSTKLLLDGLKTLSPRYEGKKIERGEPELEVVVGYLLENTFPNGESSSATDRIVRIEREKAESKDIEPRERGVPPGSATYLYAVLDGGKEKIIGLPSMAGTKAQQIEKEKRTKRVLEKNHIENQVEDLVKFAFIILIAVGVYLQL